MYEIWPAAPLRQQTNTFILLVGAEEYSFGGCALKTI